MPAGYADVALTGDPSRCRSRKVRLFARVPQTDIAHQCRDRFFDRS